MELNYPLVQLEIIPSLMYKLFKIAGYSEDVDTKFSGMINALSYGASTWRYCTGIDRIVMLLAEEKYKRSYDVSTKPECPRSNDECAFRSR